MHAWACRCTYVFAKCTRPILRQHTHDTICLHAQNAQAVCLQYMHDAFKIHMPAGATEPPASAATPRRAADGNNEQPLCACEDHAWPTLRYSLSGPTSDSHRAPQPTAAAMKDSQSSLAFPCYLHQATPFPSYTGT